MSLDCRVEGCPHSAALREFTTSATHDVSFSDGEGLGLTIGRADDHVLVIPVPRKPPFGAKVTAEACRAVWDVYVKPLQEDGARVQSVEDLTLMAILRAVYVGLGGGGQEGASGG